MLSLLSTMGIGLLTLSIGHGKTRSEEIMNTGISKESVVVTTASSDTDVNTIGAKDITQPNAVPSPTILPMPTSLPASTPTPLPVYELEEDKYPEIDALIQLYYLSKNNCDMEKLKRLLWDPSQLESESSLKSLSKIMEDYRNIKCYTKKGYIEGNYIVYVYLDYKIININTLAPGVVEFYLITDADGNLKIYSGDIDPVLKAYYDARDNDEDVQKLKKEVDNKGEEARAKDKSLDTFWQYLGLAEKLSFLVFHPIFVAFMRLPLWQPFLSAFLSSNLLFFAFFEEFLKKGNKEHALRALSSLL